MSHLGNVHQITPIVKGLLGLTNGPSLHLNCSSPDSNPSTNGPKEVLCVTPEGLALLGKFEKGQQNNTNHVEIKVIKKTIGKRGTLLEGYKEFIQYENTTLNVYGYRLNDDIYVPKTTQTAGARRKITNSYEAMTVKELKERCAKRGIKHSGMKKAELIVALRRRVTRSKKNYMV
jgi:hypothetical protein